MVSQTVSLSTARRVLARVHGLDEPAHTSGFEGVVSVFNRHQCVQSDPIEVAGRNADLTLFSRVFSYRPEYLPALLYRERKLFEYFCKMHSIMPIELYPIFKHKMSAYSKRKRIVSFLRKYKKQTRRVLNALEDGPVCSRDVVGMGRMKTGWGHDANLSNIILSRLWITGRVAISYREGATKFYALTEKVIPKKILETEPPEKKDELLEITNIIVKASRFVTAKGGPEQWYQVGGSRRVGGMLEELEQRGRVGSLYVEGLDEKFYVPIEDADEWEKPCERREDYVRFMAPLDPVIWNRKVFAAIYGREYAWEVYKKEHDRKYGYYSLPIIYNDNYVALIDPFFRKTDRVLEVRNFHVLDSKISRPQFLDALGREMDRFRSYLGAEGVEVKRAPSWIVEAIT